MTTDVEPVAPVVLAQGRFKLSEAPDGSLIAAAATGICERCRECGCGEQREPKIIPGMMVRMLGGKLKGLLGGNDEPGPDAA